MSLFAGGRPADSSIPTHLDVLGRLHLMLGGFATLAGASLFVLAAGTAAALTKLAEANPSGRVGVWILFWCGAIFVVDGVWLLLTGRALARRQSAGRRSALVLAIPNLVMVPFGTALSVYTFWVLLNDEARREYGRPLRSASHSAPGASA